MSITKFRKIRLVIVILIWLIISLISLFKSLASYKEINVGSVMSCLSASLVLLSIIMTVHFGLNKLLPNGTIKNNRYANIMFDTVIYFVTSAVIHCILIVLYFGFVYLLCELGFAPTPQ